MGVSLSLKRWRLGPVITAAGAAGHTHSTHRTQGLDKMEILALGWFSHSSWANSTPSPACLIPNPGKAAFALSHRPILPDFLTKLFTQQSPDPFCSSSILAVLWLSWNAPS